MLIAPAIILMHPWAAIVGGAAVVLPVAIHLLTKPRPVRVPLSTVRFVRQAIRQKRARHRLRDILVLVLRALAVGLLGWAFARPLTGAKPLIESGAAGDVERVILVDQSMSMGAVSDGSSAIDRARATASQYLHYQPGLRADVIFAAARPSPVFDQISGNIGALQDAMTTVQPRPQRLDSQAAVNRAAELLAAAPQMQSGRRELIIISDFQLSSWSSVDFSPIPQDVVIQFESVAPPKQPDNLAILRVGTRGRLEQNRPVHLYADIGNYSATPRQIDVEVNLGQSSYHVQGLCPAGVKTTLDGMVNLGSKIGWLTGEAKLVGVSDALTADNSRPVAIMVRPLPVYALITRESAHPHASSSHFLERALVPSKPRNGEPSESVIRVDPEHLDREVLSSSSLLVLDHPGTLSDESIKLLVSLVRRGRGLLYIAADPADANNLSRLAQIAGSDLKMPVEFLPPEASHSRHDLFVLDWTRDQAPFVQLGETMTAVAGTLRFNEGLSSRTIPGGLRDDVLATYSDRSAFLVVTPCGAGALAIMNADLAASNLPASSVFVPLVEELSGRLMEAGDSPDASPCGEPLALYLPPDAGSAQGLKIQGPQGAGEDFATLADDATGSLLSGQTAGPTGIYEVKRDEKTVFALATAAPASESDLQTLDPAALTTRMAAGHRVAYQSTGGAPAKDFAWAWILVACAFCMVGELAVLKWLRT